MRATTQNPSTKDDILYYLLKQGQAKAQMLSEVLKISPQAIRRHLKDLEAEGLIQHGSVQVGMGRPQHVYELTDAGRARFPHHYDEFAVSLLDTLAETVGQDGVGQVLEKQWQRKAMAYRHQLGEAPLGERIANLVELRRQEGYMAELVELEPDAKGGPRFVVAEYNCAISNVAESFPTVCSHELDMFARALPDCQVQRTHWMIDGENRCGYLIEQAG
ncbi:iron-sulfur cluster biosynthesis transcriptional regulator SufR [Phormidium yuhuli AB48]|uniref:Iron-sulfur cluster biosynthesis transcriptional regulator SufR n=1 Tax=Phormidium yuhuli AB48 TaxID=2940671 RepID=A0ABY5ASZ5_9CYAN|nr:iron-sulfur cluster biosynthesis transcriptional regulator SufR [Phormidium yuhuli]USR92354.1 iron-sulfur cluster biosynthesis transcriptional regulator SufR [Phormidium yuhuli AB48]